MATPSQINANQVNAQQSTGPRSPEGKARVAQNALRHGLTARHLVIREDEREEFTALEQSLAAELDPQGAVEILTFHEVLHAAWNLHRFRRVEAECSLGGMQDYIDPEATAVLDRLTRYQARAQRAYYRSLQELRILQTNRALRTLKLPEQTDQQVPAIAYINEFTKQTRSEITAESLKLALHMVNYETGVFQLKALRNRLASQTSTAPPAAK